MNLWKRFQLLLLLIVMLSSCGGEQYARKADTVKNQMIMSAALSESVCSFYSTIWRNAAYREGSYSDHTGKYYQLEFNDALLAAREEMQPSIKTIDSLNESIETLMIELNDPPTKFQEVHNQAVTLYSLVKQYGSLANKPEGSLITFNQRTEDISRQISDKINQIEIRLPKK